MNGCWLAGAILGGALLAGTACAGRSVASGAAPPSKPNADRSSAGEVAIAEPPAEEVDAEPEPAPARDAERGEFAGEWIEEWPDRGTCSDRITVTVRGTQVSVAGGDCTDGVAYEYSEARIEDGKLRFTLRVPETQRVLNYVLEPSTNGELRGQVNGGAEAVVTWRRPER